MLEAIGGAQRSVDLEMYIFADDQTGRAFLAALTAAARNGVRVRVLVDSYGSLNLSGDFFDSLQRAGGQVRFFNPLRFSRFGVRDHRKLLLCDEKTVFIGGANLSDDYQGDGLARGWFDLMVQVEDETLGFLITADFERIFSNANFAVRHRQKFRLFRQVRRPVVHATRLYSIQPGRGASNFEHQLYHELSRASSADIIVPYFLPNRGLRKLLRKLVQRGGRVRLILPALSDVPMARAAGMVFYSRLMQAGVEIYEYQPQILHAKLFIVDQTVFVGSSNLDVRSFNLNYEIMLSLNEPATVNDAKDVFQSALINCRRVEFDEFRRSQNLWQRWKNHWAHFLVARIDPFIALRQLQSP